MNALSLEDFCLELGADDLPLSTKQKISGDLFRYTPLDEKETKELAREIHEEIDLQKFSTAGPQREQNWENAWREVLKRFINSGFSTDSLEPRFMSSSSVLRFRREFIYAESARFELSFFEVVRDWIFETYLKNFSAAYEFGCGSGFNLAALAEKFREKQLTGLDWSAASVEIAELLGKKHRLNISGRRFDVFDPDPELVLAANSAVLTFCALEQTGRCFGPFLEYLLRQAPGICIHLEPIEEFYDETHPLDSLALEYHRNRGYLSGLFSSLKNLENDRRIKILKAQRLFFGSKYHEGYSLLVWKPISTGAALADK